MSERRSAKESSDQELVEAVLRTIGFDRLIDAVSKIVCRNEGNPAGDVIWVPSKGGLIRLPVGDILMVEAERDYVRLHDHVQSYLIRATILGTAERLGGRFLRVHRSSIIARDRATGLRHTGKGRWVVVVDGNREVSIGRTYLREVKALLHR